MRQAAVVDVEIRIENRLALSAEEGRLGLDPQARLHFLGVGEEPCIQVAHDLRKLICDVVLLTRILCEIKQLGLSWKQRDLDQLPVAFADGATEGFDIDQDVLMRERVGPSAKVGQMSLPSKGWSGLPFAPASASTVGITSTMPNGSLTMPGFSLPGQ